MKTPHQELSIDMAIKEVPAMHTSQIHNKVQKNVLKISKFGKLSRSDSSHLSCASLVLMFNS